MEQYWLTAGSIEKLHSKIGIKVPHNSIMSMQKADHFVIFTPKDRNEKYIFCWGWGAEKGRTYLGEIVIKT